MTVASIMLDCLTTLKKEIPELEMAYYKQDNTGCYHSGNSIISAKLAGDAIGVAGVRNDFSKVMMSSTLYSSKQPLNLAKKPQE